MDKQTKEEIEVGKNGNASLSWSETCAK